MKPAMYGHAISRLSISLLALTLLFATGNAAFDREQCFQKVKGLLTNGTLASNDTVFFRDRSGWPTSDLSNVSLTYPGCQKVCGSGNGWYNDIGPRLSTWLIPVFLLVSNMEVSPLDKRKYLMTLHLLGDPIDSLWSLLTKLEAWSRCETLARRMTGNKDRRRARNFASILGAIEELAPIDASPLQVYNSIVSNAKVTSHELDSLINRTAQHLADSRTDERIRTLMAVTLYFFQTLTAFIAAIGGKSNTPPGGRIGTAMFVTWIVTAILLSNAIGAFTSKRVCFNIMERFYQEVTSETDFWVHLQNSAPTLMHRFATAQDYFDGQSWAGAIYTYRTSKRLGFVTGPKDHRPLTLLILGTCPLTISTIAATMILWDSPPVGINCRGLMIFFMALLLFLSPVLTWFGSWVGLRDAAHWHFTLAKDFLIAAPCLTLIFLSSSGLFNSCWCWSSPYTLGKRANIPLNTNAQYVYNDSLTYPLVVGACFSLQSVVFVIMMWIAWRGWSTMRWSEKEKMDEWNATRGEQRQRQRSMGSLSSMSTVQIEAKPLLKAYTGY